MLAVCVASMVGSTWAWFTDQVVSGRNVIQVGTLDVELEYSRDGVEWHKTNSGTKMFDDSMKAMLPGNEQIVFLRINNKGSLHLKYKLAMNILEEQGSINVRGENYLLSNYIMVGTISNAELQGKVLKDVLADYQANPEKICAATHSAEDVEYGGTGNGRPMSQAVNLLRTVGEPDLEEDFLAPKESHVIALIVHTPEDLDEEINYPSDVNPPQIQFGIDVVAGQRSGASAEADSFGTDYDMGATYPPTISSERKEALAHE